MNRYHCFSVTGYGIGGIGGIPEGRTPFHNGPSTTWFVVDDARACIVAKYLSEREARNDVVRSNAVERKWEKDLEHSAEQAERWIEEEHARE